MPYILIILLSFRELRALLETSLNRSDFSFHFSREFVLVLILRVSIRCMALPSHGRNTVF